VNSIKNANGESSQKSIDREINSIREEYSSLKQEIEKKLNKQF
jgi:hypothetical protein